MSRPTGRDFFFGQGNMVQSGSFYQNKYKKPFRPMTNFTLNDLEFFIESEIALTEALVSLENSNSNYIWN